MMKKRTKILTYALLFIFLFAMAVMTKVSKMVNESLIPVVETQTPRRGTLVLETGGRGVVKFGTIADKRVGEELPDQDIFYVEGYFFEKDYIKNVQAGSEILLMVGEQEFSGTLAAKMYNYKEDVVDAIILLPEGDYTVGEIAEFTVKEARVKYPCTMARELVYKENGNNYVYLLKERDSITGKVTIAVKTEVHILAESTMAVAVSEEFDQMTKVISKGLELKDGMRVKERE